MPKLPVVQISRAPSGLQGGLGAGIALFADRFQEGAWAQVDQSLNLPRAGYTGGDALYFLTLMFSAGHASISDFAARTAGFSKQLASVVGRTKLITPASLSRLLGRVRSSDLDATADRLLLDWPGCRELLADKRVTVSDTQGNPWHVLDYDPTKKGVRLRRLQDDPHKEAPRRTDDIAGPGYTGRKRGQAVVKYGVLQHAGTELILDVTVEAGQGSARQFESALMAAKRFKSLVPDGHQVLLRADGEFGSVANLARCAAAGLPVLTRLRHGTLLTCPEVIDALETATWLPVASSGCGPQRFAAELGILRRQDERGEHTVETRLVVSRYVQAPDGAGRGTVVSDQRFEFFAAMNLPYDSFDAADVVAMYYRRSRLENSFGRMRQEIDIDKLYCLQPGGQRLALLCAMAVWNRVICTGKREFSGPVVPTRPDAQPPPLPSLERQEPKWTGPTPADVRNFLVTHDLTELLASRPGHRMDGPTLVNASGERYTLVGIERRKLRFMCKETGRQASISIPQSILDTIPRRDSGVGLIEPPPASAEPAGPVTLPEFQTQGCRASTWQRLGLALVRIELPTGVPRPAPQSIRHHRQHRRLTPEQRRRRYALELRDEPVVIRITMLDG